MNFNTICAGKHLEIVFNSRTTQRCKFLGFQLSATAAYTDTLKDLKAMIGVKSNAEVEEYGGTRAIFQCQLSDYVYVAHLRKGKWNVEGCRDVKLRDYEASDRSTLVLGGLA